MPGRWREWFRQQQQDSKGLERKCGQVWGAVCGWVPVWLGLRVRGASQKGHNNVKEKRDGK